MRISCSTVTRDFVRELQTPILILPDDIPAHPYDVAHGGGDARSAVRAEHVPVESSPWTGFRWRCARYGPSSGRIDRISEKTSDAVPTPCVDGRARDRTERVPGRRCADGIRCRGRSRISRVTRLDITSREPAFGGRSFGAVGQYEILLGTATAVADPGAPPRAQDRGYRERPAQRGRAGRVHLRGRHPQAGRHHTGGNGRPRVRGQQPLAATSFSATSTRRGGATRPGNAGSAFLMDQGLYVRLERLAARRIGGRRPAPGAGGLSARHPTTARTITGVSMEDVAGSGQRSVRAADLPGGDARASAATLTHRQLQDDPRQTVPADGWRYVDGHDGRGHAARGNRRGNHLRVRVRGPGSDRPRPGLQRHARSRVVRARYRPADDRGVANPLFVDGVPVLDHAVAVGILAERPDESGTSSTRASTRTRRVGASSTA